MNIEKRLQKNISYLESTFLDCGDIVARKITVGGIYSVYITYIDGLTDRAFIEEHFVKNLVIRIGNNPLRQIRHFGEIIDTIKDFGISSADISEISDMESAEDAMMSGDCVVLVDGSEKGIVLSSKGWPSRGIGEPESEKAIQGPREAFTEGLRSNTALIRRRIRDNKLKIRQVKCGSRSKTDIAVVYIDDLVRKNILNDAFEALSKIEIDAIIDSSYISQLMGGESTVFPLSQATERPDKAAAAILEGRIALVIDTSPFVILIPATFNMFMQASEDYYQNYVIMSFLRVLRYVAAIAAVTAPGLYIAVTVYSPSMVPSALALKMAAARQGIPFPAVAEVIMMDLAFELLREAGVRLPGSVGGTLGIVGGLIMGQAAVEAGIVSPVVVIVVALAGIASFSIPQQPLVNGFRIAKLIIILTSALFGLFGFWVGVLAVTAHLAALKSFGIPYMFPLGCSDMEAKSDMKDTIVRAPIAKMKERPFFANPWKKRRMSEK